MFADQAIFVHPDDERYTHLVGKKAINPANGEALPIMLIAILICHLGQR